MGRKGRAFGRYVTPIKSDGTEPAQDGGRGVYTLASGSTYYYILGGGDATFLSGTFTGYTSGAICSATVQDTDHGELDVTNIDAVVGNWVSEDPSTGFVGADGTGWVATNSVLAVAGTGVGGARFNVGEQAATRTRVAVVVTTGGLFRMSCGAKD